MDSKQFHRRTWGIVLIVALIAFALVFTLYDTQIVHGAEYAAQSTRKITSTETVEAARGQILDRYGRVLVSNKVVFQVTLNTSIMRDNRNDILQRLLEITREENVQWNDTLAISSSAPFVFTTPTPYYVEATAEDGALTRTLTRLGQLSLKMKWISADPTQAEHWDMSLPTAQQLLESMYISFQLTNADGTATKQSDLDKNELRALAGVLYELYLRSQEIYWTPYIFAEDVDITFISKVKENALTGVEVQSSTVRHYHTEYAAHLLGRVTLMSREQWEIYQPLGYSMNETVGKEGVELAFESYLRGKAGERTVERNTAGKIVSETWLTEPEPGGNVVLSIDIDFQKKMEDTLAASIPEIASDEVQGAACIAVDVHTGEVLASASYPTFQLATYSADYSENLDNPLKPLLNRATLGTYAPGSTFKMVTAIAGLEEGIITPATRILDKGIYTHWTSNGPMCWIYRQFNQTHGWQNVTQAIKNSCNYYFYDVGRQLGIERLAHYADMFGLGQKTGLEIPEVAGVMAGPEYTKAMGGEWFEGNTLSVAIGQESSQFTPVQLATYVATLVNGGIRYQTHLLKEVKSNDFSSIIYEHTPVVIDNININPTNLEAVKAGMLDLTVSGSVASYFSGLNVSVGAKTGTAQISAQSEANAVFVCFAPFDDPQIAIAVVVEGGGSGSESGKIAAELVEYYFSTQQLHGEISQENALIR